jgi:hypothetical protein
MSLSERELYNLELRDSLKLATAYLAARTMANWVAFSAACDRMELASQRLEQVQGRA